MLLDLLFPPHCLSCQRRGRWICAVCWPRLQAEIDLTTFCARCSYPLPITPVSSLRCPACVNAPIGKVTTMTTLGHYGGLLKTAVFDLKYHHKQAISTLLGDLMAPHLQQLMSMPLSRSTDSTQNHGSYSQPPNLALTNWLIPVPLHPSRQRQRGYNQSAALAQELGRRLNIPVATRFISRNRETIDQIGLARAARANNVTGAFTAIPPGKIAPSARRRIWIVDDVTTSGATISACADALGPWVAAGQIESIHGIAVCRATL